MLAARAVGFSPFAFTVGKGPLLFQRCIGGVEFRFHCLPFAGLVKARPVLDGLWWKGSVFSAAGVLLDALLLILMLKLAGFNPGPPDIGQSTSASAFFAMIAAYQAFMVAATLIPLDAKVQGVALPNDGKQLLGYLTGRAAKLLQAYEDNVARYDSAFRIEASWLMQGDLQMMAAFSAAGADMAAGRYLEATRKYARILEKTRMHPAERAVILDAMASIPVVHGDRSFLAAAEGWALQAWALFPRCRTIRGTLGSILVEKGACAEGLELLMPLTSEDNAPDDRALASCYVAKAFHALGDVVQASKWIESARRAGLFPQVRSRIESELGRA
ncbi:MAG: hypothetical protein ACREUH_11125 [Burkholderiales bacterium]